MISEVKQTEERQLVVFRLGEESYGIDISSVREIITMQRITKVPRAPKFVEGVINLRGNVIPVIDLRKRFGLPPKEGDRETRIVVIELDAGVTGIVVDAVTEVLRIASEVIEPTASIMKAEESKFVEGIARLEDRLVIILNMSELLTKDEEVELVESELQPIEAQTR